MNLLHCFLILLSCMALNVAGTRRRVGAPTTRRRVVAPTTRRRRTVVIITARRRSCTRKNCMVSSWSAWSKCGVSCGSGSESRERRVTRQPSCSGTACPTTLRETRGCTITEDKNCTIGSWISWSDCSTSCGEGKRTRLREIVKQKTCNGLCVEPLLEEKNCSQYVPTDCKLSAWAPWTDCSTTCKVPGTQHHSRTVVKQAQCNGTCLYALNESRSCAGHLGQWSQWSSCLAGCDRTGSHQRYTTLDCGPGIPRLNQTGSCIGTCCGKSCNDGLVYAGTSPDCSCKKISNGVVNRGCNAGLIAMMLSSLLGMAMY